MENVAHASNHEFQFDHTPKLLGHADGIEYLYGKYGRPVRRDPALLHLTHYVPKLIPGFSRDHFDGAFEEIMGS